MEKLTAAAALVVLCHAAANPARAADTPDVSFNGFGTIGVVHSDEDQADYVSSVLAPDGAGYTRAWSPEVDSRLGLQLTAGVTPRLSGVVQVVVEQRYDDTYRPTLEWANIKYEMTPELNVRVGRMVLPTYMVSEYRKVGYANPWIRPPQEVYANSPVTNIDGVGMSYRWRLDGFTNTLRGTYGQKDVKLAGGGNVKARDGVSLVDTVDWGALSVTGSFSQFRLTIDQYNRLFDAFAQFGPAGRRIEERFNVDDKRFRAFGLGFQYDPGDWFVLGELTRLESRTFIGDTSAWYVTGGYRVGAVTPYLTLAAVHPDSNDAPAGLPTTGLPPPLAATAGGLNAALDQLLAARPAQHSVSVGLRWDLARSAALKIQLDHINIDSGSPGVLSNVQPGFDTGGSVNVLGVALDFVF